MRVVFAGTPEFSVPSLEALMSTPTIELVGVYTQPDRPAGRGKKLSKSPVKVVAEERGLPVFQPRSFKIQESVRQLNALNVDLMVVAAYGLLFPDSVLDTPRYGCINVHASLLPRWRGAAPIQRAIEAGDRKTGISLMQMQTQLDSGPVLAQSEMDIANDETGGSLHQKLSVLGGEMLKKWLQEIKPQPWESKPQDIRLVTYAKKLSKAECALDWQQDTQSLERTVRAFNPWPMATVSLGGTTLRVFKASHRSSLNSGAVGMILGADKRGILVQTGAGQLNLEILQKPGGRALAAADLLNGMSIPKGMVFDSA